MKKALSILLTAVMLLSLTVGLDFSAYAAVVNEAESNDTLPKANIVNVGDTYCGEIGSYKQYEERNGITDIDYLKIKLEQGKKYTIKMTNYSAFYRETSLIVARIGADGTNYSSPSYYFGYNDNEKIDSCSFIAEKSDYYYIKIFNYFDYNNKQSHYYSILITDDKTQKIEKTNSSTVKKAKISKIKAGKKAFTVKWKAVNGIDGYQIQYSLKKSMKKAKKKTVKGADKKKTTVKKLKSNKTYYVRIRAYKLINGVKYYCSWSAKKKVKVK